MDEVNPGTTRGRAALHQPGPRAASGDSGMRLGPEHDDAGEHDERHAGDLRAVEHLVEDDEPGERGDDRLEAEQDAEHPLREVAQGDELEGVGQHRRQHGDAEAQGDVPRRPAVDRR